MNAQKCTYTCNGKTKSLRVNIQLKMYWKFHNVKLPFQLAEKEKKQNEKAKPNGIVSTLAFELSRNL